MLALSLLGRRASATSRWLSSGSNEKLSSTSAEYHNLQDTLVTNRSPRGHENFYDLRKNPSRVFRDFTPCFKQMGILEPETKSVTSLLRGRRWGKTVLGDAWLAFLRKEEQLFKGTKAQGWMRNQPLIGVRLDLSSCESIETVPYQLSESVKLGLRRAVNLKQLARRSAKWPICIPLTGPRPLASVQTILNEMSNVVEEIDHKFAIFADEYDVLVTRSLHNSTVVTEEFFRANEFMTKFFTMPKAETSTIPFQFITGSSRLATRGFWNGPNNVIDLSFDPGMARALGYTWPEIEQHFGTQLGWLEHLHQLTRDQLRDKMEQRYDCHRWSPESDEYVFNPWSVHQLMSRGKFNTYWTRSGGNLRLLHRFASTVAVSEICDCQTHPASRCRTKRRRRCWWARACWPSIQTTSTPSKTPRS